MSNMYNSKNITKQLWVINMKSLTLHKHCWWKELLGVIVAMIMTIGMIEEERRKRLMLQCTAVREDRNSWLIIAKWSSRPRDLQTLLGRSLAWCIVLWRQVQCLCKTIDKGQFQCIADDGLPFTFGSCAFRFANAGAGAACRHSLTIQDFSFTTSSTCFYFSFSWRWFQCQKGC